MAQITLNSSGVASNNSLVLQTNGTTTAVTIDTSQRAAFVAGTAAAPAITTAGDTDTGIFFPAANTLAFSTNGTEDARFDSSGNLGLGVTPSAWATLTGLQVKNAAMAATSNASYFGANWYYNAGDKYIASSGAAVYVQNAGGDSSHRWYNAPSGTAGNAITFTQAMTLDASGNLAIRAASNNATTAFNIQEDSGVNLAVFSANEATGEIRIGGVLNNYFPTFYSSNAERARIDTSGNLLVGQTAQSNVERLGVTFTGNNEGVYTLNGSASPTGTAITANFSNGTGTNGTGCILYKGRTAGVDRFYVYGNGNVVNTNNSYGALSDVKLKENITDTTPKLAQLNQVRVVTYNLIGEEQKQIGVIAQELEQIFPAMVEQTPDRDAEGNDLGTTTKSVKYSVFVPMLIKAIQEQQAIIETLTNRISALEAK